MYRVSGIILKPVTYKSMLKGSRDAVLHKLQPISIHGQLSYDVHYKFADEADGQIRVARVGPEAVGQGVQEGGPGRLDFFGRAVTGGNKGRDAQATPFSVEELLPNLSAPPPKTPKAPRDNGFL